MENTSAQKLHWLALGLLLFAGCAAGDSRYVPDDPAGFFAGLWHGLIAPIAFVIGLFADGVEIYERANSGGWYDLGFLIGISICGKSGSSSHRKWRKVRVERAGVTSARRRAHVDVDISWNEENDESEDGP